MSKPFRRYRSLLTMYAARLLTVPLFLLLRRRKNRVVFSTFDGKGFGDNSKYIALELLKRNAGLELIWLTSPTEKTTFPEGIRRVSNRYFTELYYLMTATVWVDTHFKRHIFKKGLLKKPGTLYIQTWHGSLGIKNIPTVEELAPSLYYPMLTDLKSVDYLISNSLYEDIKFRDCFSTPSIRPEILKLGHPRNDIFFRDNCDLTARIKAQWGVPPETRIFTYMPTFRKNRTLEAYRIDFQRVLAALRERFGGDWVIFMRLHPGIAKRHGDSAMPSQPGVIDVTSHPDSQELQIVSDIMCTDYSSCIYDFMLTRRPGFIFTIDLHDYNTVRGLRYPLTETPFPIAENNDDLERNIRSFDPAAYGQALEAFLEKHGCVDDGRAAERTADIILDFIEKH